MEQEYKKRPATTTVYNGVTYKSYTEASWAATFDFLGWSHAYEPSLLDGWNPDFMIHRKTEGGGRLWVEIKPAFDTFWTAVKRHMEMARLDKQNDCLGFFYSQIQFDIEPVKVGRVGMWDTFDGNEWSWWWWDAIAWWADDPVNKWGLAVPDLEREILLSQSDVEAVGGIVY